MGFYDSFYILAALKQAAANIWQTVAAPLLEQNQKELDILELEIKALEKQLAKKRVLKQENAERGAESDSRDGAKNLEAATSEEHFEDAAEGQSTDDSSA